MKTKHGSMPNRVTNPGKPSRKSLRTAKNTLKKGKLIKR